MVRYTLGLLTTSLVLAATPLACANDHIFAEEQKKRCSAGGQQDMNLCMADEYRKVDAELNENFKKLTSVLANPTGIRNAQRAWIRFRDAECSNEVIQLGGSLQPFAYYSCMIEFTLERTRHIKWHLAQDCNGCPLRK